MTVYWDAYKLDIPMQWLMANGNGNGNGNDEQRAEATTDAAESRPGSYYEWGFLQDYCVKFRQ
jgi:hypothetical protein